MHILHLFVYKLRHDCVTLSIANYKFASVFELLSKEREERRGEERRGDCTRKMYYLITAIVREH